MNPVDFFLLVHLENQKKCNNPKNPGHIIMTAFEDETLRDFVNELYEKLGLKMCPKHLTTNLPGNGLLENWKPEWMIDDVFEDKQCCCKTQN